MVFINNYFIGGADDFQQLEDRKMIPSLIKREYEKRCLGCNISVSSKDAMNCPFCLSSYVSFAKNITQIDVWANRKDDKRRSTKENKNVLRKK